MSFSKQAIEAMSADYNALTHDAAGLVERFVLHPFTDERAREFARHGFARRMRTLKRCVEKVFESLPPDKTDIPDGDTRADEEIHIQAFLFNAVGALDNLAWICVAEKGIKKESGKPLSNSQVGLSRKCSIVRGALSDGLNKQLDGMDDWFEYLEDYRHALAHRIPLYIIPFALEGDKATKYEELELKKNAALKAHDFERLEELDAQQRALVVFRPLMMHSYGEQAKRMIFHPQLLSDLKQISTLGAAVLNEFAVQKKQA